MGVKGLTSFIRTKYHSSIKFINIQEKIPEQSTIIIDGYSLLYYLYQQSNLDWFNGGEYDEFSKYVLNFLHFFDKFKLLIIFDGCQEESKRKMKIKRSSKYSQWTKILFKSKLNQKIDDRDHFNHERIFFLPVLSFSIFLNILKKLKNVEIEQSPFEADPYMAKRSYELKGYVLSSDSDFMIYNTKGMIVLDEMELKEVEGKKEIWSILVNQNDVAFHLRVTKNHLPLLTCLTGNDYISENVLVEFHQKIFKKYGGSKKNHIFRVGLYLRDNLMDLEKENILKFLKEVFPNDELRKEIMKIHDFYNIKYMPKDHSFYDYHSIVKGDDLLIFDTKEKLIENFKNLNVHSCLIDSILFNNVNWISILENDEKGSHHHWRFFRQRLFSMLVNENTIIIENYLSSGNYCSHKLQVTKSNEIFDFQNSKNAFKKIWNLTDDFECQENLLPLICVLKWMKKIFQNSIENEFDCFLISLLIKEKSKESNTFISSKIQNLSSKFQLGLYYANIINDLLQVPFEMEEINLMYSGETFSKLFSTLKSKDSTIEQLIKKYNINEKFQMIKKTIE
eukprot:gene3520-6167_t